MTPGVWNRRETGYFLLALAWIMLTLGVRPLALPDEGRYISAAWEMVVSGNWLYPTLDGLPFFHKPPLFYWIAAASLATFGVHEWAGRLAAVLGAAVAAFTLYGLALRQATLYVARLALLVLTTTPLFYGGAQFGSLDMLVAGFICAATVLAAEAAINAAGGRPHRSFLAAAYACAALGLLAKGLIGAVLPGLTIVIWLLWSRRPALLLQLLWLPGLALFGVIALPWFFAMQARFPDFFHYFFVYQQFQRFAQGGFNNPKPFWFYLPVLAIGLLPWSLLIGAALRRHSGTPSVALSVRSLMWVSAGVTVGFFSIPASKMLGYVLPAVPPLAFLIADGAGRSWRDVTDIPRKLRGLAVAGIVTCLAAVVAGRVTNTQSNEALSRRIAGRRAPGEPLYFVGNQYFDVPFYLRLRDPVPIFDDWGRFASIAADHDDWRNAVYDAGRFDPVRARQLLLEREQLAQVLCGQRISWLIAKNSAVATSPVLRQLTPLFSEGDRIVLRVAADDLAAKGLCQQTPSGGSPGKSPPPPPPG